MTTISIRPIKIATGMSFRKTKDFPWDKLPYELREQIFDKVTEDDNYFKTSLSKPTHRGVPPLVVALRSLPVSYSHVLEWFAKFNEEISISDWVGWEATLLKSDSFPSQVEAEVFEKVVEKVEIQLGVREMDALADIFTCSDEESRKRKSEKSTAFKVLLQCLSNVREVHINFPDDLEVSHINFIAFATGFHYLLNPFKSLSKVTVAIPYRNACTLTQQVQDKIVARQTRHYSRKLRIRGSPISYDGKITWVWKAPAGRYMDWSQELGSLWYITWESSFPHFPYPYGNLRFAEIGGSMNFQTRMRIQDDL